MPERWEPVPLAGHGSWARAAICEDSCPHCGPLRAGKRAYNRHRTRSMARRRLRPADLTPADLEALARLRGWGFSVAAIAHAYGISAGGLHERLRRLRPPA